MDPDSSDLREDTVAGAPKAKSLLAAAGRPGAHRGDRASAAEVGNVLTKVAVVVLSGINAVMWDVYTQSPLMAALWAAIAVGFVGWMIYDARHR
jgi:hypothetical protein